MSFMAVGESPGSFREKRRAYRGGGDLLREGIQNHLRSVNVFGEGYSRILGRGVHPIERGERRVFRFQKKKSRI